MLPYSGKQEEATMTIAQALIAAGITITSLSVLTPVVVATASDSVNNAVISNTFSGRLIIVYDLSVNNWLWGYSAYSADSWSDVYNWGVTYNADSTLTFINKKTNTCMVAYSDRGLTHNTCTGKNDQKFSLWPTASGAVQIKSVSLGKCIAVDSSDNTSDNIKFHECTAPGNTVPTRQLWTIGPERNDSESAPQNSEL